jgi:hypothetical protein
MKRLNEILITYEIAQNIKRKNLYYFLNNTYYIKSG